MFDQKSDRTLNNWHFNFKEFLYYLVRDCFTDEVASPRTACTSSRYIWKCKEYRGEILNKCHSKLLKEKYSLQNKTKQNKTKQNKTKQNKTNKQTNKERKL